MQSHRLATLPQENFVSGAGVVVEFGGVLLAVEDAGVVVDGAAVEAMDDVVDVLGVGVLLVVGKFFVVGGAWAGELLLGAPKT